MNWFEKLFGFSEQNPDQVRQNLLLENGKIHSKINRKEYDPGIFELISLAELRKFNLIENGSISMTEVIADVRKLHRLPENNAAVFQAASQFNVLEMVGPSVSPEEGVGIYDYDNTQGPACAIACGAGTVYRNYFVPLNGEIGQSLNNQVDCLEDIHAYFQNKELSLWEMKNGYCLATREGLAFIDNILKKLSTEDYEILKGLLKVGIQHSSEVTDALPEQKVTQVYCSAVPVAYSGIGPSSWEKFARLILDAAYEATFLCAVQKMQKDGNRKLFLTLVGGGAFGNPDSWIYDAIMPNLLKFRNSGLEVIFVSYGSSNALVRKIIKDFI